MFEDPRTGQKRWEVLEIKTSNVALVYVGIDVLQDKPFAAKTYKRSVFTADPQLVESLRHEAGVWIGLPPHPNVVAADQVETLEGKPYLFMMYYAQGDLAQPIQAGTLRADLPRIIYYAMQICDGLSHAYMHRVRCHRDIKPRNCLLFGHAGLAVTDFGIARPSWPTGDPSPAWGTLAYMAPEQWADKQAADERTDVYAIGATLFEMISGRPVFGTGGGSRDQLRRSHESAPVPRVDAPAAVDAIVQRCLEKAPARRFQSARELRTALEEAFCDVTGHAAPAPHPPWIPDDDPTFTKLINVARERLRRPWKSGALDSAAVTGALGT